MYNEENLVISAAKAALPADEPVDKEEPWTTGNGTTGDGTEVTGEREEEKGAAMEEGKEGGREEEKGVEGQEGGKEEGKEEEKGAAMEVVLEVGEPAKGGADEDISMYGGDALFVVLSEFFVSDKKKGSRNIADILEDIADSLKKISNKKK